MIRLDRFLTLHFFGPVSRLRKSQGLRIPILMYHSISDEPESGHPYFWINSSPDRFAQHMKYLHNNDYQIIGLSQAVELIRSPGAPSGPDMGAGGRNSQQVPQPIQPKYVVLTFDDGYLDFYTRAFPVLQSYGFTATAFLPTSYIDGRRPGLRGKEHLNWDQVRELHTAGIDFGSHTVNHPQLHNLKPEEIDYELRESKKTVEFQLNQTTGSQLTTDSRQPALPCIYPGTQSSVDSFCYPYKFPEQDETFQALLSDLLKKAGYSNCVTTKIGSCNTMEDMLCLKRLPMNGADDDGFFRGKLQGNYDWLACLQSVAKRTSLKSRVGLSVNQMFESA